MTGDTYINIIKGREMTNDELLRWHHNELDTDQDIVVEYYGDRVFIGEILFKKLANLIEGIELKDGWILVASEEYGDHNIDKISKKTRVER